MKEKRVRIGCAAASLLMGISGTYAYYRSSAETINKIAVGDVNIGIQEYEEDGEGEKKYEGPEGGIVLPSQVISKIPRITNYAEPCYVRVKPVFGGEKDEAPGEEDIGDKTEDKEQTGEEEDTEDHAKEEVQDYCLGEEDLGGIEDVWLKAGEYYYYPKVLERQESVDFFHTITVPSAWTSAAAGQALSVEIQAEAVQAANVTPDFTAEAPWGETLEIEQCVHEADNTISEVSQQSFLTVSYEGAARNLILAPDNFFRNFPVLMPGDEREDTFTLTNTTNSSAEFFLRTEVPENLSEEEKEMLSKVDLEIRRGDLVLYEGDLKSEELRKEKSLGTYRPGEQGEICFSLHVPSELGNAWAMQKSEVKWIFSVEGEELPEEDGPSIWHSSPKTGLRDPSAAVPMGIAITGALLFLTAGRPKRRKG